VVCFGGLQKRPDETEMSKARQPHGFASENGQEIVLGVYPEAGTVLSMCESALMKISSGRCYPFISSSIITESSSGFCSSLAPCVGSFDFVTSIFYPSRDGASSAVLMRSHAFATAAAWVSVSFGPLGQQRLHARKPARSASSGVL
jgi:hypothetical protein